MADGWTANVGLAVDLVVAPDGQRFAVTTPVDLRESESESEGPLPMPVPGPMEEPAPSMSQTATHERRSTRPVRRSSIR